MSPIQRLHLELSRLPDVKQSTSRFGSHENPAWSLGGREFAHLHSNELLDLRLPPSIQQTLREDSRAHFRAGSSEWLEFEFHTLQDVEDVLVLVRQAWAVAKAKRK